MSQFWADERADAVEARHPAPYVVSDTKTPSGTIHVGALRGVVLHDAMARQLRSRGHSVRYIYGFDDFDPFDKIPKYLDSTYAEFLGKPMVDIPAPDENGKPSGEVTLARNYGRHYADEFEAVYRSLGVESDTVYSSQEYRTGRFDEAIRLVLDRRDAIQAAYDEAIAHRSDDRVGKEVVARFPVNVRCEACGKIATTEVTAWDGTQVTYACRPDVVPYVVGCGHTGTLSPLGGNAKLPWKIEWAAKWFIWKSDLEGGGKDHYTKGGSRDVARAVFSRVFAPQAEPGYNTVPEDLFYEWFYVGGAKMSTSKGVGQSATAVANQIPAELLRLLMVRTRPRTAVNYEETPDAIPDLYDEYDRLLAAYRRGLKSVDGTLFELIRLREHAELPEYTMRFRKVTSLVEHDQLMRQDTVIEQAEEEKGSPLTDSELAELVHRVTIARTWFAQHRSPSTTAQIDDQQKEFLLTFLRMSEGLETWDASAIQSLIHDAKNQSGLAPKQAFQAIYAVILGATSGPQAGHLLASRDKAEVLQTLQKAVE
ncbi:lysine--tRNA ligase [Candidatus Berkelbacteria bacterium]|nr:lysine--tRNA ligase [Candidatus Berkelbacteria bacterium]